VGSISSIIISSKGMHIGRSSSNCNSSSRHASSVNPGKIAETLCNLAQLSSLLHLLQVASSFSHMLNLHNLTEEVANTQTERAGRMGEVRITRPACTQSAINMRALCCIASPPPPRFPCS
jgi:hypothetical protein